MNLIIRKLEEKHLPLVDAFSCIESDEQLKGLNSKERRRIKKRSREMEDFLKEEAFEEQEKSLNTTHLFIDENCNKIVAYISLCNDSIGLEFDEKEQLGYTYTAVPAVKIARLAVSNEYQKQGIAKQLIQFAAYMGVEIRNMSGLAFITLDCYEHRVSFYESIGFIKNSIQPPQREYDTPISMRLVLDEYLGTVE